jgi:hypothetical protein
MARTIGADRVARQDRESQTQSPRQDLEHAALGVFLVDTD